MKLKKKYKEIQKDIEKRLEEYREIWRNGSNEDIHAETFFLYINSTIKSKKCLESYNKHEENTEFFLRELRKSFRNILIIVRFKNNKAKYLVELREQMTDERGK